MKPKELSLSLKIFPDGVLRALCDPVETFNAQLREWMDEMFEIMRQSEGIGLAAPQAGISRQLFVCGIENDSLCLINPTIIQADSQADMIEGCLSLPDMHVKVTRNDRIVVAGYDIRGRQMRYELTGLWARVVQHEMDHLKGVLICDYGENVDIEKQECGPNVADSSNETNKVIAERKERHCK